MTKASSLRERSAETWRPAAILFDLDGTLIDGYSAIAASVNHVRDLHGLAPMSDAQVRASVGNGVVRLLEVTVPQGDVEENVTLFLAHHDGVLREGTVPMPEVALTLEHLFQRGYPMGVCSNKPIELTRRILRDLDLDRLFRVVLGPELVERRKPAPDMLLSAADELGVAIAQALYVGDMVIDIRTARAAGAPVWVVPTGSHSPAELAAASPDRLMASFSELLELGPARRAG